ncbi:hypothetical protein LWI28_016172 [Acer negundo]|uniref:Uncharacterized protein n=1 Tax=Acer negundo TaxID=4023 RepID=A0AAD5ILX2_ACENE|nr:hypothetical protein LWI28_016172 [Acer negundo]
MEERDADKHSSDPQADAPVDSKMVEGNRNFKGKANGNKHGNSGGYEKNGNTGKLVVSISVKKVDGVSHVANMGRSSQLKTDMNGKQSTVCKTSSACRVGGSSFEILNTEDDGMIIEGDVLAKEVASGSKNIKGKYALTEITNQKGSLGEKASKNTSQGSKKMFKKEDKDQDSANVLRQFHVDVTEFEGQFGEGPKLQDLNYSDSTMVSSFDVMASNLEEPMVVMSE